ncbi:MAG: hypothetical protein GQE15_06680 [Archangiaceae bacterium]|nr:hypothetical protein [Archangiaceae bacterium]
MLSAFEMSPHERELLMTLSATRLTDLAQMKQSAFLAAARAAGLSDAEASSALQLFAEYLSREGLRFARESPFTIVTMAERPVRSALRPGLIEHAAETGYRCHLLSTPPEPQDRPDPNMWEWRVEGFRVSLQVRPTELADDELLSPPWEAAGVLHEGPWGALVVSDRLATKWNRSANHTVEFYDAEIGFRAIAEVDGAPEQVPQPLIDCARELACSLAPGRPAHE